MGSESERPRSAGLGAVPHPTPNQSYSSAVPSGPEQEAETEGPTSATRSEASAPPERAPAAPVVGPGPGTSPDTRSGGPSDAATAGSPAGGAIVSRRPRSRLARLTGRVANDYSPILEPLVRTLKVRQPKEGKEDLDLIIRAFEVAEKAHAGQKRKSGDPYITHPVAVATILAELGMTGTTLAGALLHDTVEDTSYSLEQLRRDFGDEVAVLVDGVTKLDKVKFGDAAQAETVRKMVLAMAEDVRVLVIKLADRLHNARTWRYVAPASSARKAKETLEIYAPLAHRLGMNTIKWELEDLSFAALYPKVYAEIVRLVGERTPEREKNLAVLRGQIEKDLKEARVRATVTGRPKHFYSIYQKMIVRGKDFDEIHDLTGVRVLVDSVRDCYGALGVLHAKWSPLPGRFKDYIAMPKLNMYQSLHTTVIGPGGKPVEIQLRTHEMHRRAEYGVAAHWKYKDQASQGAPSSGDQTPGWLRSVMDWQKDTTDPNEFLESLRAEIDAAEVFVFTPKGEVMALPAGSTPVDFAYAVHTEVGHRTIGARVNGKLVPLNSELHHGDWVEIFTSKTEGAGPSQDWLGFVRSPRARNKIRHWFSKERREESIEKGKEQLTRQLRKMNLPLHQMMSSDSLTEVAGQLNLPDIATLYAAIGDANVSVQNVIEHLQKLHAVVEETDESLDTSAIPITRIAAPTRQSDSGVMVQGSGDVMAKLARCCTPVPPDEIIGFVTRGSGVSVHRADCKNIDHLKEEPDRIVEVSWAPTQSSVFLVEIQVEALDRKSLLSDVTRMLAEHHVNILSASVNTSRSRVAISKFVFEMGDPKYLSHVLSSVRRIDGVYDVYRTAGQSRPAAED